MFYCLLQSVSASFLCKFICPHSNSWEFVLYCFLNHHDYCLVIFFYVILNGVSQFLGVIDDLLYLKSCSHTLTLFSLIGISYLHDRKELNNIEYIVISLISGGNFFLCRVENGGNLELNYYFNERNERVSFT